MRGLQQKGIKQQGQHLKNKTKIMSKTKSKITLIIASKTNLEQYLKNSNKMNLKNNLKNNL